MHKKIVLKLALLLSNASLYATQTKLFIGTIRKFCSIQKAQYITPLVAAVRQENTIAVKALLEQGNQDIFSILPDTGHSLAHTAIRNNNVNLLNILYQHGARLLPEEQTICRPWKSSHPRLFQINPDFVPGCLIS